MTEYADLISLRRVETTTDRMRHATRTCDALCRDIEADRDVLRAQLGDARRTIAAVRAAAEHLDRAITGRLPSLPDVRAAVEQLDRALAHDTQEG